MLRERIYSVRQAALLPAAPIFDAFTAILDTVYLHRLEGSGPPASLDDVAYFARQRMEFLKRLYSNKHGVYKKSPAPLDGVVHIFGLTLNREIWTYPKIRAQAKPLHDLS